MVLKKVAASPRRCVRYGLGLPAIPLNAKQTFHAMRPAANRQRISDGIDTSAANGKMAYALKAIVSEVQLDDIHEGPARPGGPRTRRVSDPESHEENALWVRSPATGCAESNRRIANGPQAQPDEFRKRYSSTERGSEEPGDGYGCGRARVVRGDQALARVRLHATPSSFRKYLKSRETMFTQ